MSNTSLLLLSYNNISMNCGIHTYNIEVGIKYKLLELDGVNFILLGKCLINEYTPPSYMNDGRDELRLKFEYNNNYFIFKEIFRCAAANNEYGLHFYGDGNRKLNIYIDDT